MKPTHSTKRFSSPLFLQVVLAAALLSACGAQRATDEGWTSGPPAAVTFDIDGVDVRIFVDEAFLGAVSEWPGGTVPIPAGEHRLELRSEGFYPHRRDLQVEGGRSYTLRVRMIRRYD